MTDMPNMTKLCHDFYTIGQKLWDYAQIYKLTNTQISAICTAAKNDRTVNYTTNSTHTAIMQTLSAL